MEGTAVLLLELGAVFVLLSLLGLHVRGVGLPTIPLTLLAGFVLGEGGVAALTEAVRPFVDAAAQIGLVLLLALGLEFSFAELVVSLRRHAIATPGSVVGLDVGLSWGRWRHVDLVLAHRRPPA